MNFDSYRSLFRQILDNPAPAAPYDNQDYLDYTRLNWSRQQRWLSTGILQEDISSLISGITGRQQWIIITEPWCGDAAHTVPFIHMLSLLNPLIETDYQLRDAPPFLINEYLTNHSKSIPKLVIRDVQGTDIAVWGPRPAACQEVYDRLREAQAGFETIKTELQHWYNRDKGVSFQAELYSLLSLHTGTGSDAA